MQLVIAEKPSVARNIAKVLHATNVKDGYLEGKEYLVSWCIGHLIELASADQYRDDWKAWRYETLPMIPENWKYQIKESTKGQFRILKELLHRADVTEIICATDAGREGELIFRLVYNQAECKLPFKRLWISSMEEKAILERFQQLKDGHEYDDLYYSAVARSEADWLVGINATRLFTVLYHHRLIVGRVQTPTLAMLVEREQNIENFRKEKYYLVHLLMDGLDAVSSRIKEKSAAVQMMEDMKDETAQILSVKKEKKKVQPPKLYDLTTLQREANRLLGFTAQQTLDYTQSLYEKKLVTYPRADSQYLTDDMEENALLVVGAVNSMFPEMSIKGSEPDIKRLLNSKKVSDHHAIIPTVEITNMDLKALPGGEKEILMLIASKLLCASEQEYIYESIKTEISCHTVYLKEITAPEGYVVQASSYGVKLVVGSTTKQTVTDKEQKGNLTVYKEGEVFVGAVSDENGTSFQYEKRRQKGAVYNVYAAEDIVTAGGKTVYKKGAEVAKNLITGENGSVTVKNLPLGSYNVTEAQAPENFYNAKETKKVTISYAGQTAEAAFSETTFTNDRQKAVVQVIKKDKDTENTLSGGHFALFAAQDMKTVDGKVAVKKDALIETAITGTDGKAAFKADLPVGFSYYVKEVQAPAGYVRNEKDTYSFQFSYTNDEQAKISFSHTFVNDRVSAAISLNKKDAETKENKAQGDASLENAVYGLYARNDITHPDGKTGVIYKAGSQIGTLTTDKEGKARIENLYLGEYYIKEITPSVGYLADEHEYDLVCSDEGDLTAVVEKECTSLETVKKQPFELIKAANNGDTDAALLSGAGFSAYLVSSLVVKEDGNYDFSSAEPVVIGENGATEIFTNEKGYVKSIAIPYGTYLVRETTTPHNYKPVDDFIVRITENKPTEPQTWRVLLDKEFSAKLKIIKQDDETKKSVLIPGTEFKIYDMDHEKYVEQVTTYPTTVTHTSYFTDIDGYLILPQNLKIGHYRIEEVTAPDGYTINKNYVEIQVDTNTLYQTDPVSGDAVIEVVYEDHSVKGKLTVQKKGEVLSTYKNDFRYEVQNLSGAVYEVYAAEDIYTADFQKDDTGKRILKYAKGEKVAELTTDESGKAELDNLPLGEYKVVEKTAPEGFVLNEEEQKISFVYADQNTPVISQSAEFINDRQKVEVSVVKKDAENEKGLSGAEFGLYAKEDIKAGDKVLVKADELLTKAVTGEDGKAVFEQDLPFGTYYIKELAAPDGFVSSDEQIEVTAKYQGQEVKTVKLETVFRNAPTTTEFTKSDITTGVELDGATLTVLDSDGKEVEKWTSVKGKAHVIKRLHVGKTYTLREEFAPYGYLQAEEVKFTVSDTAEVQKVEMKDAVPVGRIIINKKGEFVKEVTWKDMLAGGMDAAFGYVTGSLKDVTFEIYAAEDIKAADGESSDYYKKDELVATITTDALGYARSEDLPLGKYYVKEKETADGYVLDGESREIDLTYRDQNTPVVTYDEDWQNNRQKAKVTVVKKEKNTDRVLEGGVFALYTKNDILNAEGEVILKADTMIEQKATDQDGRIVFTADLPINGSYYVKEVQAPAGFVTTEEIKEFDFTYAGEDVAEVSFEFTYEDEPTTFEITKSDLTTGEELPGAKLKVSDPEGNVVDEWTSGSTPHIIKELEVGKKYTLTETIPADGYATAESITFVVENTADIQKVEMQDDTTKILISKVDMTDGSSEVKGAKLYILNENQEVMESWTSGDQPHYVEKLPIGTYTLLEETAPKGYIVANKVTFEIKDTGDIQGAKMEDEQAMGKVILNKTDKDTKKPMKGVEFALCDSKGKVLETLVTDSAGHAESKNYPIATFKNGQYKKAITYILKETKTLDGYQLDETEHKIQFEYVNDRTPVIEYTLDLTNKKAPEKDTPETSENQGVSTPGSHGSDATSVSNSPKTGDNTNIAIFVLALAVSAGCLGTVVAVKRKRK